MLVKKFKKANALLLTTVILFAVSTIAAGITMYFYRTSILSRNTNIYFQKHIELENEFNKHYLIITKNETSDLRTFFINRAETTKTIPNHEGGIYSTIHKQEPVDGQDCYTFELETISNRRECRLIKTIYLSTSNVFSVDSQEVYYVTITN